MKENFGILSPVIWFILLFVLAAFMFAVALTYFVVNSVKRNFNLSRINLPKFQFAK